MGSIIPNILSQNRGNFQCSTRFNMIQPTAQHGDERLLKLKHGWFILFSIKRTLLREDFDPGNLPSEAQKFPILSGFRKHIASTSISSNPKIFYLQKNNTEINNISLLLILPKPDCYGPRIPKHHLFRGNFHPAAVNGRNEIEAQ